jgi:hypothetical protein
MEVGEAAPRGSPPNRLVASAAVRPGNERDATRHLTTRVPDRLSGRSLRIVVGFGRWPRGQANLTAAQAADRSAQAGRDRAAQAALD